MVYVVPLASARTEFRRGKTARSRRRPRPPLALARVELGRRTHPPPETLSSKRANKAHANLGSHGRPCRSRAGVRRRTADYVVRLLECLPRCPWPGRASNARFPRADHVRANPLSAALTRRSLPLGGDSGCRKNDRRPPSPSPSGRPWYTWTL